MKSFFYFHPNHTAVRVRGGCEEKKKGSFKCTNVWYNSATYFVLHVPKYTNTHTQV